MNIKLNKPFAANSAVDEFDVKQVKKALNRLGYYQPYEKVGITGIPDTDVFSALKSFQKDHGLQPTGTAKPDDETVSALSKEASKTPKGYYVWRTVGDERVRASHSAHDWETRAWDEDPDPGEEFNCRCWAVPATPEQIDKKKKQKCFAGLPWEDEAKSNIKDHEKDYEYPYIDSTFNITIGYGINIDKKSVFVALPWKFEKETGPDATKEQIESAYAELTRQKSVSNNLKRVEDKKTGETKTVFNVVAGAQRDWSHLILPQAKRDDLFQEKFNYFRDVLPAKKFSDFDCFPPPAKIALIDMIFNMGETVFSRGGWPNLFKAVNQRDWRTAAEECSRKDVPEERNTKTRNFFIKAAEMEEQSQK